MKSDKQNRKLWISRLSAEKELPSKSRGKHLKVSKCEQCPKPVWLMHVGGLSTCLLDMMLWFGLLLLVILRFLNSWPFSGSPAQRTQADQPVRNAYFWMRSSDVEKCRAGMRDDEGVVFDRADHLGWLADCYCSCMYLDQCGHGEVHVRAHTHRNTNSHGGVNTYARTHTQKYIDAYIPS